MKLSAPELRLLRLQGQHLLTPAPREAVLADLCGLQAQLYPCALHGLRLRSGELLAELPAVRTWTLRGTLHLIREADLPLLIHRRGAPEEVCAFETYAFLCAHGRPLPPERAVFFAQTVYDALAAGPQTREDLRQLCRQRGVTPAEEAHVFHAWGGVIRQLSEMGLICGTAEKDRRYRRCGDFVPLPRTDARRLLLERYLRHYGPASLADMAYFFRWPQRELKALLAALPAEQHQMEGETLFSLGLSAPARPLPPCRLLAGFDPLMLGYEKRRSCFLPPEYLRGIFNLTGMVFPALLIQGVTAGRWKLQPKALQLTAFRQLNAREREAIREEADRLFPGLAIELEQA